MKSSTWPNPVAVLVSKDSNSNMLMRELLRPLGWSLHGSTDDVREVATLARKGEISLAIIIDRVELPMSVMLRRILSDPFGRTLPILAFVLQHHSSERKAVESLLTSGIVHNMPLTPSNFQPAFQSLIRKWDVPPLATLRGLMYQNRNPKSFSQLEAVFSKFVSANKLLYLALPPYAALLRRRNKFGEAENKLLDAVKKDPGNIGVLIALGEHYIKAGSPGVGLKLFRSVFTSFNHTSMVLFDMLQTMLIMGELERCQDVLITLMNRGILLEECALTQAKIYFAQGRRVDAERSLTVLEGSFRKMRQSWDWTNS